MRTSAKFEMKVPSSVGLYEFMEMDMEGYGFTEEDISEGEKSNIVFGGSDEILEDLFEKEEEEKDGGEQE